MNAIAPRLIGRFGNQMFIYAHARALSEQQGRELHTQPWIGQQIFQIDDPPLDGSEEVLSEAYHQDQASLIYSRADCRRWFAFRPEVEEKLRYLWVRDWSDEGCEFMPRFHQRVGDYLRLGYPVVGLKSYLRAAEKVGGLHYQWVAHSEEGGCDDPFFRNTELSFLPDFYDMVQAKTLFRGNSSFSWWAATLGNGRVFSPVIEGLKGGMEHDNVPFVEGNHPRFCELEFVTDLYLRET